MIVNGYGRFGDTATDVASVATTASGILNSIANIFKPSAPPVITSAAPEDDGIFGVPKTVALVGGGVLLLGIGAFVLTRKKR